MTAQRYRKLPIEVEAIQYLAVPDAATISRWADGGTCRIVRPSPHWYDEGHPHGTDLIVGTLEDGHPDSVQVEHVASLGDWIVKGVLGEFYPVKPEVFAQTYEAVT